MINPKGQSTWRGKGARWVAKKTCAEMVPPPAAATPCRYWFVCGCVVGSLSQNECHPQRTYAHKQVSLACKQTMVVGILASGQRLVPCRSYGWICIQPQYGWRCHTLHPSCSSCARPQRKWLHICSCGSCLVSPPPPAVTSHELTQASVEGCVEVTQERHRLRQQTTTAGGQRGLGGR